MGTYEWQMSHVIGAIDYVWETNLLQSRGWETESVPQWLQGANPANH